MRLATVRRAARDVRRDEHTIRNAIKDGRLAGYRVPDVRGICVDLDAAERVFAPPQHEPGVTVLADLSPEAVAR